VRRPLCDRWGRVSRSCFKAKKYGTKREKREGRRERGEERKGGYLLL